MTRISLVVTFVSKTLAVLAQAQWAKNGLNWSSNGLKLSPVAGAYKSFTRPHGLADGRPRDSDAIRPPPDPDPRLYHAAPGEVGRNPGGWYPNNSAARGEWGAK